VDLLSKGPAPIHQYRGIGSLRFRIGWSAVVREQSEAKEHHFYYYCLTMFKFERETNM
jgi:hypothetical protein